MALEYFDKEAAKIALDERTREKNPEKYELEHIEKWDTLMSKIEFKKTKQPLKWRLLIKPEESGKEANEPEEVIFSLKGFIVKKELPPFSFRGRSLTTAIHRVQHIVLCGFGSERFDAAVEKLHALDDTFMREVGEHDFIGMKIDAYDGQSTVELMNWIFTSSDLVPGCQHIPFPKDDDPYGDMEKARGMDLIRTEDNVVDYFTAGDKTDSNDTSEQPKQEVYRTKLTSFQVGDLVEVGFSVVASPV